MEKMKYQGLNAAEVARSRIENGANVLAPPVRIPWYRQYLKKFSDPVIRILMLAAILSCLIGDWVEGGGILIAILLATFIAFINEYRAEKEFDLLNRSNDDLPYKTIREGAFEMVPRRDLVVGDVIFIEQGEEVPADAVVLEAVNLQLDQSSLTGETDPVEKFPTGHPEIARLGECIYPADKLMRGTPVVEGYGYARLIAVGEYTEIGRTAREASLQTDEETPLQKQLEKLSRIIGLIGFLISILTFGVLAGREIFRGEILQTWPQWLVTGTLALALGVALLRVWLPLITDGLEVIVRRFRAPQVALVPTLVAAAVILALGLGGVWLGGVWPSPVLDMAAMAKLLSFFMIAVTLIVVAVPEGLAMSVTLSLAYSMRRMTASNNLVRKMHACETIGAATVICTDKTGTLTMNRMRVAEMRFAAFPEGKGALLEESIAVNTTGNLSIAADGSAEAVGNPTEGALLLYLHGLGLDFMQLRFKFQLKEQLTFSTERKFMATYGRSAVDDAMVLYAKGAPEILLARSTEFLGEKGVEKITPEVLEKLTDELESCQARGMRTLAICMRRVELPDGADLAGAAQELTYLGFAAISDPVRPEVPPAIECCRRAGIQVKVVTGDSPETASEIGRQIGLAGDGGFAPGEVITGREYAALDDEEAVAVAHRLRIMARARPEDKLKLVRALKRSGEVVAVTGDGTNDAPALNNSDVGIAMGKTGTAIAKEAAAIILLDDSFASVVNAVLWGRSLYANIQRFIIFQLTINVTALTTAVIGPFLGVELPLTVIQMLWINLIMDTFAALALATEPPDPGVMNHPPRSSSDFIVTPGMARNIFGTALVLVVVFIVWMFELKNVVDPAERLRGQTVFFSVFVLIQFWNLFNVRSYGTDGSLLHRLGGNRMFYLIAGAILVGQIVIVTFGGKAFRVTPLSFGVWGAIIGGTSLVLWCGELLRFLLRRLASGKSVRR